MIDEAVITDWRKWIEDFVVNDIRKSLAANTLEVSLIILCLVGTEALSGYFTGKPKTGLGTFIKFMEKYFPSAYKSHSRAIYWSLRCGLVHSYIMNRPSGGGEAPFIMSRNKHEPHLVPHSQGKIWFNREIFAIDFINAWEKYANDVAENMALFSKLVSRINALGYLQVIETSG